ncbi:UNVERIFIED_CONTAM: hypothetical protein FO487_22320, partial [Bacillus amyloliquefaciens DSM 7 = ATCC 23350]
CAQDLLTPRVRHILKEAEKGWTNQEISGAHHLSKRLIAYACTSIFNKRKCGTRQEAVLISNAANVLSTLKGD